MLWNPPKKQRISRDVPTEEKQRIEMSVISSVERDDDIFYEILKHLDARGLAMAACVNRRWRSAAEDETLWEHLCTRNFPSTASCARQLRSVVLALGGFRRLYVLCLRPLRSSSTVQTTTNIQDKCWSKDEVYLSLSLFSIDCYERLGAPLDLKLACKPPAHADPLCYLVSSSGAN